MIERQVNRYETSGRRRVYCLPLEVFKGFFGNVYLVLGGGKPVLVDTGSGQDSSNRDIERGFAQVRERFNENVELADVGVILITHGHIDHFGGLHYIKEHCDAPIGVHILDRRVLVNYYERLSVTSRNVDRFLAGAGMREETRSRFLAMYRSSKRLFKPCPVDFTFDEEELLDGEFRSFHVPGHCPGQVCLLLDDILLTADHILPKISPHLSPEAIALSNGVGHYRSSLAKARTIDGVRLALGGHKGPIEDLKTRIDEIDTLLGERLEEVLEFCDEPRSIIDVSRQIFGEIEGYHALLATFEAGALVEDLYQRGHVIVSNYAAIEEDPQAALLYQQS